MAITPKRKSTGKNTTTAQTPSISAKKAKKEPKTEPEPTVFVPVSKLTESLSAVAKLQASYVASKTDKSALFEAETSFIQLQVELKKIPPNFSTFIHSIALPAHWRHALPLDTCLIVPDLHREPLDDRDLDLEQTKEKYLDLLEQANAGELIKEILPMRQLRNEFRPPALRAKLSDEFAVFLCDRKLLQNKYTFLARFLGKAFWVDGKKVPLMVDFTVPPNELRAQLEDKLNQTNLYVSGKGSTLAVTVGSLEQKPEQLLANLQVILTKIHDTFGQNVRALTLKTAKSSSVMFYMDLGSSNEVEVGRPVENGEPFFVEDEFDLLTNAAVRVYRDGTVRVMKKQKDATADPEKEEPMDEDDEEPDQSEVQFIKQINRPSSHDWIRHKVTHIKKSANKKGNKRLSGSMSRGFGIGKRFFSNKKKGGAKKSKTPATTAQ